VLELAEATGQRGAVGSSFVHSYSWSGRNDNEAAVGAASEAFARLLNKSALWCRQRRLGLGYGFNSRKPGHLKLKAETQLMEQGCHLALLNCQSVCCKKFCQIWNLLSCCEPKSEDVVQTYTINSILKFGLFWSLLTLKSLFWLFGFFGLFGRVWR